MQGQCGSTNYCVSEQEKVVGLAGQNIGVCYAHALLHAIIGGCGFDLPKSGAAMADPAAPLPTPLHYAPNYDSPQPTGQLHSNVKGDRQAHTQTDAHACMYCLF